MSLNNRTGWRRLITSRRPRDIVCVIVSERQLRARSRYGYFIVGAALLTLSACAGSSVQNGGVAETAQATPRSPSLYKVGKPYQIKGIWYYPQIDYDYAEEGVASWYGPGFHGKATANGETYDMNDLTAAHRTLPLPSIVRVTNLDNGRSIKLRVNDRGPFAQNRILDVSRRGADLLGIYGPGTAHVRVEIVADESRQLAIALTGSDYPSGAMVANRQPLQPINSGVPPVSVVAASSLEPTPDASVVAAAAADSTATAVGLQPLPAEVGQAAMAYAPTPQWSAATTDYAASDSLISGGSSALAMADSSYADSSVPVSAPIRVEPLPVQAQRLAASANSLAEPAYPRSVKATSTPVVSANQRAYVQAGAFANADNAHRVRDRLSRFGPVAVVNGGAAGSTLYRVRLGPLASVGEAERVLPSVIQAGFPGSQIVVE